jgi:hypothetical protein
VALCSAPSLRGAIEPYEFEFFVVGVERHELRGNLPRRPPSAAGYRWANRYEFAGVAAQQRFPDLLAARRAVASRSDRA